MDDYLTKPLNPAKLIRTIEAHLKTRASKLLPENLTTNPAIDYDSLLARCLGDVALLRGVAQKFESKSSSLWEQLLAGYKAGDIPATTRNAHSLRGTALNLSAAKLAQLAAQLEALSDPASLPAAESTLQQIRQELDRCHEQLRVLVEST